MTTVRSLYEQVGATNRANGWHDRFDKLADEGDVEGMREHIVAKIALIDTEAAEAIEEIRKGSPFDETYYDYPVRVENGVPVEQLRKPEGVPSELADVIIRTLDLAYMLSIDIEAAILEKLEYNATRGVRHGGKTL